MRHPATAAVVLCAGRGKRMGAPTNKVFVPLAGKPLLAHTLAAFESAAEVDEVLLVAHPDELKECHAIIDDWGVRKVAAIIAGGATRHQSEDAALAWLRARIEAEAVGVVLIHDGARPFVTPAEIDGVVRAAREHGGALLATPLESSEIVAVVDADRDVTEIAATKELWRAQTPQGFSAAELLRAYDLARADGFDGTDTAASYERLGHRVHIVRGSADNFKVTTPDDLVRAEALLARGATR
jgi:2-C-methyl-D-erythritol 4-phosphate cytidylyltransferase